MIILIGLDQEVAVADNSYPIIHFVDQQVAYFSAFDFGCSFCIDYIFRTEVLTLEV